MMVYTLPGVETPTMHVATDHAARQTEQHHKEDTHSHDQTDLCVTQISLRHGLLLLLFTELSIVVGPAAVNGASQLMPN